MPEDRILSPRWRWTVRDVIYGALAGFLFGLYSKVTVAAVSAVVAATVFGF